MYITLPLPPSVNALYGGGSKQQRFPSKAYNAWLSSCPCLPPVRYEQFKLTYNYYFPDNKARDCENYVKALSDLLVKSQVIVSDSWQHVQLMTLRPMGIDKKNPRVQI